MGTEYILVNETKKEQISFAHLNGRKMRELAGNHAQSSTVTWYLSSNVGDDIQFIGDVGDDWPVESGSREIAFGYPDKTEYILNQLIEQRILQDKGFLFVDDEEPDTVFIRHTVNVWQDQI